MTKKIILALVVILVLAGVAGYFSRGLFVTKLVAIPNEGLSVTWQAPMKITDLHLVRPSSSPEYPNLGEYYRVGLVTSDQYQGSPVVLAKVEIQDELSGATTFHLIQSQNKLVLLKKNLPDYYLGAVDLKNPNLVIDDSLSLADLILPSTFNYNNSRFNLEESYGEEPLFDPTNLKQVFTDPKLGSVYTDSTSSSEHFARNGFYVKASDGTLRTYTLAFNFYDAKKHLPQVTWADGAINKVEYLATDVGGCGTKNLASVNTTLKPADLAVAGKTAFGDAVYLLADNNNPILQSLYDGFYPGYDQITNQPKPKMSYADFVALRPVFFWYDSFGRLIKFQRSDILPAAECGKPVIYLYPPSTTNVSVKLDPKGGFTKSEPDYGAGWKVIATPDSQITDLASGKTYPYLFWEGRGGLYDTPKKGFVVSAGEVHSFLIDKLSKLGLNKKEQADFMEFWEPRMTGALYFFVTFLGNREMDQLAPLTIMPRPDTVIRILMDFSPLQKPIEVQGYEIKTPARSGFTVVEWGGVIR